MKNLFLCFARRFALAAGLLLPLAASSACGGQAAKSPNPMRSIDEGRAVKLIAVALEQEGLDPDGSRSVKVDSGKPLQMDVGVKGRKYGFVYLTASDIKNLHGDALAQHSAAVEDLIIRTNEAEDEHFVVLYAQDYLYDDNSGESHEATMITAENKLQRDARDFIVIARDKEKWP